MADSDFISEKEIPANWTPVQGAEKAAVLPHGPVPDYIQGTIASTLQHDAVLSETKYKGAGIPQTPLMPIGPGATAQVNAATQSVVKVFGGGSGRGVLLQTDNLNNADQNKLNLISGSNITLTPDQNGGVSIAAAASASVGDGLTHGDTIWDIDPAYVCLRDEFQCLPGNSVAINTASIGTLGWLFTGSGTGYLGNGLAPIHLGEFGISPSGTQNLTGALSLQPSADLVNMNQFAWPLLDYPGWKLIFIWRWHRCVGSTGNPNTVTDVNFSKTSTYIGLGFNNRNLRGAVNSGLWTRPPIFIGARFDKDPGVSFTLTSVGTAAGGVTVYTGTTPPVTANFWVGSTFTIAGFTIGANNGTFQCTASTSTTLTLNNTAGSAETHAATATIPAISDTTIKLEAVENAVPTGTNSVGRNNAVGTVVDTTLTPTEDVYYRLEIECVAAGVVTMSLNGSAPSTFTLSIVAVTSGTTSQTVVSGGGLAILDVGTNSTAGSIQGCLVSGPGSNIAVAGLTGGNAGLNGTWVVNTETSLAGVAFTNHKLTFPFGSTIGSNSPTGWSITGYPVMTPFVVFGNDSEASPVAGAVLFIDYFAFVWNKGLITGGATPDSTLSRYW